MEHEPRRLRERVDFITSPGYGDGSPGWRTRTGLARGGPAAVITTRAVEKYVSTIFSKLGLPSTGTESKRVLAVLAFLRS